MSHAEIDDEFVRRAYGAWDLLVNSKSLWFEGMNDESLRLQTLFKAFNVHNDVSVKEWVKKGNIESVDGNMIYKKIFQTLDTERRHQEQSRGSMEAIFDGDELDKIQTIYEMLSSILQVQVDDTQFVFNELTGEKAEEKQNHDMLVSMMTEMKTEIDKIYTKLANMNEKIDNQQNRSDTPDFLRELSEHDKDSREDVLLEDEDEKEDLLLPPLQMRSTPYQILMI